MKTSEKGENGEAKPEIDIEIAYDPCVESEDESTLPPQNHPNVGKKYIPAGSVNDGQDRLVVYHQTFSPKSDVGLILEVYCEYNGFDPSLGPYMCIM